MYSFEFETQFLSVFLTSFCYKFALVTTNKAPSFLISLQTLWASAQKLLGLTISPSMLSSMGLHAGFLILVLSSGYLNTSYKESQPPIDVDLVDIEFTTLDQDLSKLKVIPKKGLEKANNDEVISDKSVLEKNPELAKKKLKLVPELSSEISKAAKDELKSLSQSVANSSGPKGSPSASSLGNSQAIRISYNQYLVSYINKYKTYPRIAERLKQQGVVVSKIVISKDGKLLDVIINKSSGFSTLDQGTVKLIKSLAPFKPLPDHFKSNYEVSIPIEYILGS